MMQHLKLTKLFITAAAALLVAAPLLSTADELPSIAIGASISNLRFKDIRFVARTFDDLGEGKAYVLVFTNITCPVAQKYWPKIKRLEAEWRERGVQFVAVNSAAEDSIGQIAEQALEFGLEFPFVKD